MADTRHMFESPDARHAVASAITYYHRTAAKGPLRAADLFMNCLRSHGFEVVKIDEVATAPAPMGSAVLRPDVRPSGTVEPSHARAG